MLNSEYDREFIFDIDAYLIETYGKMNMTTRRSICRLALEELDSESLEEIVDVIVADFAVEKMNYRDPDPE